MRMQNIKFKMYLTACCIIFVPIIEVWFMASFARLVETQLSKFGYDNEATGLLITDEFLLLVGLIWFLSRTLTSWLQHVVAFDLSHIFLRNTSEKLSELNLKYLGKDFFVDCFSNRLNMLATLIILGIQGVQSTIIILTMSGYIIYRDPLNAISVLFILILSYLLLGAIINRFLNTNSTKLAQLSPKFIEAINFNYINGKVMELSGFSSLEVSELHTIHNEIKDRTATNMFLAGSPKLVFEWIIFTGIVGYIFYTTTTAGIASLIVILIAAQRILPNIQQLYMCVATYKSQRTSIVELWSLLSESSDKDKIAVTIPKQFNDLTLKNISVQIGEKQIEYRNIQLKNDTCYQIIGTSGSGKTILLEVVAGLREFTGRIFVDGIEFSVEKGRIAWSSEIAYYDSDLSLYGNDLSKNYDHKHRSSDFFRNNVQKIGMNGSFQQNNTSLSLGQRQRALILRSLTEQSVVLLFDEPTNALDRESAANMISLIESVGKGSLTLITSHDDYFRKFEKIYIQDHLGS